MNATPSSLEPNTTYDTTTETTMTDIDMDGLVPNPFPTIQAGDDARALMAQLNQALTAAETALYKADTLVAVLNDTDDFRDQWLPWNQGRNLRMRVQQAIDAVVTAQAMHASYPTTSPTVKAGA